MKYHSIYLHTCDIIEIMSYLKSKISTYTGKWTV